MLANSTGEEPMMQPLAKHRPRSPHGRQLAISRRLAFMASVALALLGLPAAKSPASDAVPALRVLTTYGLPGAPSTALDVRWAGERSVYVMRRYDGVDELALSPGLPAMRRVVPDTDTLGFREYKAIWRLAASDRFLAFAAYNGYLAWRSLAHQADHTVRFERRTMGFVDDVDLAGDRLLVLGGMFGDPEHLQDFSPDGAVAFLGSARETSEQTFRPILFDPAGAGAPHLLHCGGEALGVARFLPDGSIFVVPGFQPGAHLFSRDGKLLRTWSTDLLGLDTAADCARRTIADRSAFRAHPEQWLRWLNRHRVVDEVLPLPGGPGLIVRRVEDGRVRWELDVLRAQGIERYEIEVPGATLEQRVSGDVRGGRIVLLVVDRSLRQEPTAIPGKLVILEAPRG
jgi:hypothetical protein